MIKLLLTSASVIVALGTTTLMANESKGCLLQKSTLNSKISGEQKALAKEVHKKRADPKKVEALKGKIAKLEEELKNPSACKLHK